MTRMRLLTVLGSASMTISGCLMEQYTVMTGPPSAPPLPVMAPPPGWTRPLSTLTPAGDKIVEWGVIKWFYNECKKLVWKHLCFVGLLTQMCKIENKKMKPKYLKATHSEVENLRSQKGKFSILNSSFISHICLPVCNGALTLSKLHYLSDLGIKQQ